MRLEARESPSLALVLGAPIAAVLLSLALSAVLLAWADAPIGTAFGLLFEGALGSRRAIAETLLRATPLILTGLAAGDGLSAGVFFKSSGRLLAFLIGLLTIGLLAVPRAMRAIVRLNRPETTLVGSIGLVASVPITTGLAALVASKARPPDPAVGVASFE